MRSVIDTEHSDSASRKVLSQENIIIAVIQTTTITLVFNVNAVTTIACNMFDAKTCERCRSFVDKFFRIVYNCIILINELKLYGNFLIPC